MRELHPEAEKVFRDAYLLEFLDIPEGHRENDLHASLLANLQHFLIELGRDFCFVGMVCSPRKLARCAYSSPQSCPRTGTRPPTS